MTLPNVTATFSWGTAIFHLSMKSWQSPRSVFIWNWQWTYCKSATFTYGTHTEEQLATTNPTINGAEPLLTADLVHGVTSVTVLLLLSYFLNIAHMRNLVSFIGLWIYEQRVLYIRIFQLTTHLAQTMLFLSFVIRLIFTCRVNVLWLDQI